MDPPSKSALNRLGSRLRKSDPPSAEDREVYREYAATFLPPLNEAIEAVVENSGSVNLAELGARIKKFESVVAKLRRQPTKLASIEDIGGCRLVVLTLGDIEDVHQSLDRTLNIVRFRDYREDAHDGYRAVHLVAQMTPRHRIEIQIRTELQNEWANLSEHLFQRVDPEIKYGGGPRGVRQRLDALSDEGWELDRLRQRLADGDLDYRTLRQAALSSARFGVEWNAEMMERVRHVEQEMGRIFEQLNISLGDFRARIDALRHDGSLTDEALRPPL